MGIHTYEFHENGKLLKVWQTPSTDGWRSIQPDNYIIFLNDAGDQKVYRVVGICHIRSPANAIIIEVREHRP